MTGVVEWPVLVWVVSAVIAAFMFALAIAKMVFNWLYVDSNQRRKEADELRGEITKLRGEVAQTYVTLEAHRLIKEVIDRRGDQLEAVVQGLSVSVDKLSDRHDKAIADLVRALTTRFTST